MQLVQLRGRGTPHNPANRFDGREFVPDVPAPGDDEQPGPRTQFLRDHTRGILSTNDSPDVPFDVSLNAYRGCEHGCVYCFARPTHEYLGFSAGLDFEAVFQRTAGVHACRVSEAIFRYSLADLEV